MKENITESSMWKELSKGAVTLPPLQVSYIDDIRGTAKGARPDLILEARWGALAQRYAVELRASSTPMAFETALGLLTSADLPKGTLPMVVLPYLNDEKLRMLEGTGVSGLDLCGNGFAVAPGRWVVQRSGRPNLYPSSASIKNIYRKNSSMVPRVFLAQPKFGRVSDILAEINRRNPLVQRFGWNPMTMGTVSKALSTLKEDLVVSRERGSVRLIQVDKLLDLLMESYAPQNPAESWRVRVNLPATDLPGALASLGRELNLPVAATGLASATRYAVMQRGDLLSVYCTEPEKLLAKLPCAESDRFPNLELLSCDDELPYFDARRDETGELLWASPVQAWLEMMRGDKRDRETASQIRSFILGETGEAS